MSAGTTYRRLSTPDAALIFMDHQTGLSNLVRDFPPEEFRNNVLALAALGKLFQLPTVLTSSLEQGPNGPLMPELRAAFPNAPCIARPGEINAWDNPDFLQAVRTSGRRQLIFAGIVTEVCVAFPALSAIDAGYDVFVVTDASGTFNTAARHAAWARMSAAGVQLLNWFAVACELQRDWRKDMEGLGTLLANHLPEYRNLIESHHARTPAKQLEPV